MNGKGAAASRRYTTCKMALTSAVDRYSLLSSVVGLLYTRIRRVTQFKPLFRQKREVNFIGELYFRVMARASRPEFLRVANFVVGH